jgi:hypothetical protein
MTLDGTWCQLRALTRRAEQAIEERRWAGAVERWPAVLAHPCAHHQVVVDEIH